MPVTVATNPTRVAGRNPRCWIRLYSSIAHRVTTIVVSTTKAAGPIAKAMMARISRPTPTAKALVRFRSPDPGEDDDQVGGRAGGRSGSSTGGSYRTAGGASSSGAANGTS